MLDDLKRIHELDAKDALGIAEREPQQLAYDFAVPTGLFTGVENVVYAGMGGSALAATLVRTWPTLRLPFELVRDYDIPSYVDGKTLFIASSYSGNTEETLSALQQAETQGAQIVVVASGGALRQVAEQKQFTFVPIPPIDQPRYAVFYNFRALLEVLASADLLPTDFRLQLTQTVEFLNTSAKAWLPTGVGRQICSGIRWAEAVPGGI
jgi:glucose/mannose-6-phosphate isomerase